MLSHSLLLPVCKNNVDILEQIGPSAAYLHHTPTATFHPSKKQQWTCTMRRTIASNLQRGRICPSIILRISCGNIRAACPKNMLFFQGLDLPPWGTFALIFGPLTVSDEAASEEGTEGSQMQSKATLSLELGGIGRCPDAAPALDGGVSPSSYRHRRLASSQNLRRQRSRSCKLLDCRSQWW